MNRLLHVLVLFLALQAGATSAQGVMTFDGCVDSRGQQVRSILDETLDVTFDTRLEDGRAVIRYNPAVLPRLGAQTRMFLFAYECARLNLGMAPEAPRMLADARRADCWAVTTLLRAGHLSQSDIETVQDQLSFSLDEWMLVPEPPRGFDLQACYRESAARPSLLHPAASQNDWNTCTRRCGDTLFACQRRVCGGGECDPCMPAYRECVAECEFRFPR